LSRESNKPFLSLIDASFRLGDRLVFENMSWRFESNQHWGITGPNGCGKSIFGGALLGHLPLVHGELTWHFKPPNGFSAEDCIAHMAFEDRKALARGQVLQSRWHSFEQDHTATVADALTYERVMEVNPYEVTNRHRQEKQGFERRQRQAINLLKIGHLLERKLIVLSNGESQKVHLVRALSRPLRCLILDEPFTGLDGKSREHFHSALRQLMSSDLRVLVITADPESLPEGITHLMHVEDFKVVQMGPFKPKKTTGRRLQPRRSRPPPYVGGYRSNEGSAELVRMRNVTVSYGGSLVLRNVNWTIRQGESWALLGPNGSGKTTLLSLITGDHPQAFSNDITVLGQRFGTGGSVWTLKKRIGLLSPELHLHFPDGFTCLEAVESGFRDTTGLYDTVSAAERRTATQWLARFDLRRIAHMPLYELSAGQQRATLLARALVKAPALLILDEPCQVLDGRHRELFLRMLDGTIRARKATVVYVTHNEWEIPASIQRVMRL
jgi:molybdate transport system ATP-binding protein